MVYWKARVMYGLWLMIIVFLGLLSRRLSFLPVVIGDVLWAVVVYLGWRLLLPMWQIKRAMCLSLLSAYMVEGTQLLTWSWLVFLRNTTLGYLILGKGFVLLDLVAYSIGIGLAAFLDSILLKPTGHC